MTFTTSPTSSSSFFLSLSLFSVIITTVLYLSEALRKNFLNDKFDYKVGEMCVWCVCGCVCATVPRSLTSKTLQY